MERPEQYQVDQGILRGSGPPTCDIDITVERCQGEAPLVVIGEVWECHPLPWWGKRQKVRVAVLLRVLCSPDFPGSIFRN